MRRFPGCRAICRNEANWRRKWLSWHGGCRFVNRCFRRAGRLGGLGGGRGLEVLEDFEGAEVHAISRIDAPLNGGEGIEGGVEGVAEGGIMLDGGVEEFGVGEIFVEAFDAIVPELCFNAAESALGPLGGD